MRIMTATLILTCLALTASAQTVTVGSLKQIHPLSYAFTPPYTLIDLSHPANADGTVTSAAVAWGGSSCTAAFKLKFLRPTNTTSLTTYSLVGERGPFNAVAGRNQLPLTPPIDIKKGDLIAVTSLVSHATCGGPTAATDPGAVVLDASGDVSTGTFGFNGTYRRGESLIARATDTTEVLEGVITAAGSLQGNFGSFFRTSLQIISPGGGTSTGKLIFHPAGAAFSATDQAIPYTVSSGAGAYYPDIVQTMGQSGLGTIDVISNNGFPPLVTARVYNDAGASGTSGFTEDLITPTDALHTFDSAVLITPGDLTNFRVNIGVRTFSSAATVNVQYGFRSQSNKDFPANTFRQYSLADFGDTAPVPNEQIILSVVSGDVVIYLSTTDNRTNDSSVRFAKRE
jgi:hypothetical protein